MVEALLKEVVSGVALKLYWRQENIWLVKLKPVMTLKKLFVETGEFY